MRIKRQKKKKKKREEGIIENMKWSIFLEGLIRICKDNEPFKSLSPSRPRVILPNIFAFGGNRRG